jgi:hypothetical protein
MEGFADLHEVIIKRNDLPKSQQTIIFDEHNCVAVHHGGKCHRNTKENDKICIEYLLAEYGLEAIQWWIASLRLRTLPGRAGEIMHG